MSSGMNARLSKHDELYDAIKDPMDSDPKGKSIEKGSASPAILTVIACNRDLRYVSGEEPKAAWESFHCVKRLAATE